MAQAISGLWAVSIDGIQFAYFNTTQSMVGAWAYRLDGNRKYGNAYRTASPLRLSVASRQPTVRTA